MSIAGRLDDLDEEEWTIAMGWLAGLNTDVVTELEEPKYLSVCWEKGEKMEDLGKTII